MKASEIIRDRAWQFVGAVISLLALVVALWPNLRLTTGEPTVSLCNYQQFAVFKTDPAPLDARDRLRLIFRGKEIPVTELSVTHFCLSNYTARIIEQTDFAKPLSFKASDGVDVIYVRSYRQDETTAVAADWRRLEGNRWEMNPTVLNPGETLWVQMVYRVPETLKTKTFTDLFQWQALFKGATFKVARPTTMEPSWYYLQIKHEGLGLYLLVGAGLIFSFVTFSMYRRRMPVSASSDDRLIILVILAALSWATAEMAVDVIYNQRASQPVFGWLFVVLLAVVAVISVRLNAKRIGTHSEPDRNG